MLNRSSGNNINLNNHQYHNYPQSPMNLPFPHPATPSNLLKRNLFSTSYSSTQLPTFQTAQHQLPLSHLTLTPSNINIHNLRQSMPLCYNFHQSSLSIPTQPFDPNIQSQSQSQQSYDYLRNSLVSPVNFCDCSLDSIQLQRSLIKSQYLQSNCKQYIEGNGLDAGRNQYFSKYDRIEQRDEQEQQMMQQQYCQEQKNFQGNNSQQCMLEQVQQQHHTRESQQIASQQQNQQERSLQNGSIHRYTDIPKQSRNLNQLMISQELQQVQQQEHHSQEVRKRRNRQRDYLANHNGREISRSITSSSSASPSSSSSSGSSLTSDSSISKSDIINNNICPSPQNTLKNNTKRQQKTWFTTQNPSNSTCKCSDQITTHRSKLSSHRKRHKSRRNRLSSNIKWLTSNQHNNTPRQLAEHRELLKINCSSLMKEVTSNKWIHDIFLQNTKDFNSDELRCLIAERSYPQALLILLKITLQIIERINQKNTGGDVLIIGKKDRRQQIMIPSPQIKRELSDQRQSQQQLQSQYSMQAPPPFSISSSSQFKSFTHKDHHHEQQRQLRASQQLDNNIFQRCNTEPVVSRSNNNFYVNASEDRRQLYKLGGEKNLDSQQYYSLQEEYSGILQDSQYQSQIRQQRYQELQEGSEGKDSQIITYEQDEDSDDLEKEKTVYHQIQQQIQDKSNAINAINAGSATDNIYQANFESFTIPQTTAQTTEIHKTTFSPHFSKEEDPKESDHIPLRSKRHRQLQQLDDNIPLERNASVNKPTEKIQKFNIDQFSALTSSCLMSQDTKHENYDPKQRFHQQSFLKGTNKSNTARDNSKDTKNSSRKYRLDLMPCMKIKAANASQNLQENLNSRSCESRQPKIEKQQSQINQASESVREMYLNGNNTTIGSSPRKIQSKVIHSARYSNEDNNKNSCQNSFKIDSLFKKQNVLQSQQQVLQNVNNQKRSEMKVNSIVGIEFAGIKKKVPLLPKQQRIFDIISGCELTDRSN